MNRQTLFITCCIFLTLPIAYGQTPISQKAACKKFSDAIVRIDVSGGVATGFIVSQDGWIVTAAHVMFDPVTHEQHNTVAVQLPKGGIQLARLITPITNENLVRDYVVLKVEQSELPHLELSEESAIESGSEVTLIGYPFSAGTSTRFCLSETVAATNSYSDHGINVDIVYFQGVAVKGVSGAPLISRDTGRVIGIQSRKLSGIGPALDQIRQSAIQAQTEVSVSFAGIGDINRAFVQVANVLDEQLANGLGAGTSAADAFYELKQAKRNYERQHPKK